MPNLITELGYLGFEVSDLAAWDKFAGDVIGFGVEHGPDANTRRLRMDEQVHRIILTSGPADDLAFSGWRTANAAALKAFTNHLDANGVAWTKATKDELALRLVEDMIHFSDSNGFRHEVYFGPKLACTRFVSPTNPDGFDTQNMGCGHIVYMPKNPMESWNFCQKIIGLEVSDYIRQAFGPDFTAEVGFLHLNERHHSVAVGLHMPPMDKSIHHFSVSVNSMETVGFTRERAIEAGCPIGMDIGQHPNDRVISVYIGTPSGFLLEIGWGGIKVQDDWQVKSYDMLSEWGHKPLIVPSAAE